MSRSISFFRITLPLALLLLGVRISSATVLYDGSQNNTLADQGWFYLADGGSLGSPATSPSSAASAVGTLLQTMTPDADRAGFSRLDVVQNRILGYTLRFQLRLDAESHASNDRAGFSLTALSSDLSGIELGFWSDRVFAQSGGPNYFQHAEETLVNAAVVHDYLLTVQGNNYSLTWDGGAGSLTGDLRNYTGYGNIVYFQPNLLALSDNTAQAAANVWIGNIEFQTIPEPGTWSAGIILFGSMLTTILYRHRRLLAASPNYSPR